jgi:hypothetical protein
MLTVATDGVQGVPRPLGMGAAVNDQTAVNDDQEPDWEWIGSQCAKRRIIALRGATPPEAAHAARARGWKLGADTVRKIDGGGGASVLPAKWQAYFDILGWPSDALEVLLAGRVPTPVNGAPVDDLAGRVDNLERALAGMAHQLAQLVELLLARGIDVGEDTAED